MILYTYNVSNSNWFPDIVIIPPVCLIIEKNFRVILGDEAAHQYRGMWEKHFHHCVLWIYNQGAQFIFKADYSAEFYL